MTLCYSVHSMKMLVSSLEEECLPSFEVLNYVLNLAASCLDNGHSVEGIASVSAVRFALPSIP